MAMQTEGEREIDDPSIQLHCKLFGSCPVQGEGTVMGKRLYFRARWDAWSFAVAESDDVHPANVQLADQGFLREGSFGEPNQYEASWMPCDDAEAIIRRCAREYVASTHDVRA